MLLYDNILFVLDCFTFSSLIVWVFFKITDTGIPLIILLETMFCTRIIICFNQDFFFR